jgi:hypothetical protein
MTGSRRVAQRTTMSLVQRFYSTYEAEVAAMSGKPKAYWSRELLRKRVQPYEKLPVVVPWLQEADYWMRFKELITQIKAVVDHVRKGGHHFTMEHVDVADEAFSRRSRHDVSQRPSEYFVMHPDLGAGNPLVQCAAHIRTFLCARKAFQTPLDFHGQWSDTPMNELLRDDSYIRFQRQMLLGGDHEMSGLVDIVIYIDSTLTAPSRRTKARFLEELHSLITTSHYCSVSFKTIFMCLDEERHTSHPGDWDP